MPHIRPKKYRAYSLDLAFWLALVFMAAFPFLGVSPASAGPKTQATLYKFSGETLKVPYQWDTVNCQSVRSQLFWHQPAHTSPVGKVLFSQCHEDLQWKLPKPNQPADYELVVEVFSQDRWNNADAIQIKVFPRNLMDPLRNWAKNNTLMVADSVGKLDAVLKYFKIPYEKTFGFEPPSPQAIILHIRIALLFNAVRRVVAAIDRQLTAEPHLLTGMHAGWELGV